MWYVCGCWYVGSGGRRLDIVTPVHQVVGGGEKGGKSEEGEMNVGKIGG